MFAAASTLSVALALLQSGAAPSTPSPESLPVQFVVRGEAMKAHATVVNNELTISAGVDEPYLSSTPLGDFQATGEIARRADSRATLQLYATVGDDARVRRGIEITLPPNSEPGWQPMTVSSLNGHVRVTISGLVVAEREVAPGGSGSFGFEVSAGEVSLRRWRAVRYDMSAASAPADAAGVLDARRLPADAQVPRLLHEVKPQYTEGAMRRKAQGVVDVEAVVEADGSVRPLRVVKSLDEELDAQALAAVQQWKFEPALLDGKPVPCRVSIELTFVLRGR